MNASKAMAPQYEEVVFHGDTLHAIRDEQNQIWLAIRPACEALGLDPDSQQRRLRDPKRCSWATTVIMTAVGEDGKSREMFCLRLDCVPMWLATITIGKVRVELREKLSTYQKECARVLSDHFLSPVNSASVLAVLDPSTEAIIAATADRIAAPIIAKLSKVEDKVDRVDAKVQTVTERVQTVADRVTTLETAIKLTEKRKDISTSVKEAHVRAVASMSGCCPACATTKIVVDGSRVSGEFDHFYARYQTSVHDTWLICKPCHTAKTARRDDFIRAFEAYQERRGRLPESQLRLV